ncbi:MAG: adenylyl-sulfate kinase [Gammaproteobacteria bacterium]|nr:MAG: adenylyl-sulfate kinase [Gammaproteobacteria bacterium]
MIGFETMQNKTPVLWFTGLSGAGKSTLSQAVYKKLRHAGFQVTIIDGDILRQGLCKDLGFTKIDRSENIRRAGEVAKLFADAGIVALAAFMSPTESDRNLVRGLVGTERFVEIYCKCSFDVCESRDVKGLYKKARSGQLKNFVGLDESYEEPTNPEVTIDTDLLGIEESTALIMNFLKTRML